MVKERGETMLKKLLVLPIMLIGLVAMNTVDLGAQVGITPISKNGLAELPQDIEDYKMTQTEYNSSVWETYVKYDSVNNNFNVIVNFIVSGSPSFDEFVINFGDVSTEEIFYTYTDNDANENSTTIEYAFDAQDIDYNEYNVFTFTQYLDFSNMTVTSSETIVYQDLLSVPTATISNTSTTSDSLTFDYDISDPDGALITDGATYTVDGNTVTLASMTGNVTVSDLLSDTSYDIDLELSYDIGDGTGTQTDTITETVITDSLTPPTINITNLVMGVGSFTFDYVISDPDNTLLINGAQYTVNGTSEPFPYTSGTIEVSGLEMDTEYTLETSLDYDLNDGSGILTSSGTQTVATEPSDQPVSVIGSLRLIPIILAFMFIHVAISEFQHNTDQSVPKRLGMLALYLIFGFILAGVLMTFIETIILG